MDANTNPIELCGTVAAVIYQNEENGYTVLKLDVDDGMDKETREIARRLSLGQGNVTLWTKQTNSAAPCSSSEP